jgi:2-(1,2-epoxy-1,2-dihydrophenyl)acetyl-CoA isomerase
LLGDSLKAAQLQEWGLVWECVDADQLLSRAMEVGSRLAAVPAATVLATRQIIDAAGKSSFTAALEQERLAQRELCDLPVFSESVARFMSQ